MLMMMTTTQKQSDLQKLEQLRSNVASEKCLITAAAHLEAVEQENSASSGQAASSSAETQVAGNTLLESANVWTTQFLQEGRFVEFPPEFTYVQSPPPPKAAAATDERELAASTLAVRHHASRFCSTLRCWRASSRRSSRRRRHPRRPEDSGASGGRKTSRTRTLREANQLDGCQAKAPIHRKQ